MKRIAIIIPYIGKFRNDFNFWLKSVESNPTIDFLIFTDNNINDTPKNVHVINMNFKELVDMFQRNFDFKICINKPYKFCDFKPTYGEVFRDYIRNYDFWGYTDTDIVYGNLRKYVTEDMMDKYDHIFGRGHFSLYRNTPEINRIYKDVKQPTYQQVFTFDEGRAFDEYCGTSKYWAECLPDKFYESIVFDDIDCSLYHFESQMRRKEYINCKNFIYSFEEGTLYRIYEKDGIVHKEETMYVHFQKRDMKVMTLVDNKFLMIPNAFVPFEDNIDVRRLKELAERTGLYPKRYLLKWKDYKSKFYKFYLKLRPSEYGFPKLPKGAMDYYKE